VSGEATTAEPHPRLSPLSLGDLLDQTFAIYRRRFRAFLGIAALVQVPVALVGLPLATMSTGYFEQLTRGAPDALAVLSAFGGPILVLGALISRRAQPRHRRVEGDAVNPRGQGGIAAEGSHAAIHLEEDVLRDLLGVFLVPEIAEGKLVDFRTVCIRKVGQGAVVAVL